MTKVKNTITVPATGDEKKETVGTVGSENKFLRWLRERAQNADGMYLIRGKGVTLFLLIEGGDIAEDFDQFNEFKIEKGQLIWADIVTQNGNTLSFKPSPIVGKVELDANTVLLRLGKGSADVTELPSGNRVAGILKSTLKRRRY